MIRRNLISLLYCSLLCGWGLTSCTTSLDRAEDAGYISDKVTKSENLLPFDESYIAPEYAKARTTYQKIYIPQTDTTLIAKQLRMTDDEKSRAQDAV